MVFSSPFFISVFFPCLLVFYVAAGSHFRNMVLLVFSMLFYAWGEPKALPVMLAVILLNYCAALALSRQTYGSRFFIFGIIANLCILFFFKYLDFIVQNINLLLSAPGARLLPEPHIPLPIGISFYIFQAMSYLIDVYRGQVPVQKSLFRFALYISLFPQLVAGPIVRYSSVANDLGRRGFVAANFQEGLIRFCIGLAKKVFIADSLGYVADCIFDSQVNSLPCLWAWCGAIAFALQIYYDFSAYSDMAIGIGKMFNFTFPENFNFPYAARSIRDFWRRWHMSLTAWLKDYLYIPLGGSRRSFATTCRNILIVLLCCGMWHGASWNFAIWGLYNGLGLAGERILGRISKNWADNNPCLLLKRLHRTFTILFILIGWVIFRTETLDSCVLYIKIMFLGNPDHSFYSLPIVWENCLTYSNAIFLIIALVFSQPLKNVTFTSVYKSLSLQIGVFLLFVASYAFLMTTDYSPFLYFRF